MTQTVAGHTAGSTQSPPHIMHRYGLITIPLEYFETAIDSPWLGLREAVSWPCSSARPSRRLRRSLAMCRVVSSGRGTTPQGGISQARHGRIAARRCRLSRLPHRISAPSMLSRRTSHARLSRWRRRALAIDETGEHCDGSPRPIPACVSRPAPALCGCRASDWRTILADDRLGVVLQPNCKSDA